MHTLLLAFLRHCRSLWFHVLEAKHTVEMSTSLTCAESKVFKSLDFTQDQRRISRLDLNDTVQVTQF